MGDLSQSIERATEAKLGLPRSALEALEAAAASFAERPISGITIRRFDIAHVRGALSRAARKGGEGQTPAALYEPGHGEPLVVFRCGDVARLLRDVERRGGDDG